jgi:hypothetical protein
MPQDIPFAVAICAAVLGALMLLHDAGQFRRAARAIAKWLSRRRFDARIPPPSRWWGSR